MADLQVPAWLAVLLTLGLPATGWFGREFVKRRWASLDRKILRVEANLEEQRRLLIDLNGDIYQKWIWLADHPDAEDRSKAEPVANEIGTWLYKHSTYFPERIRVTLVNLGHLTFHLATEHRDEVRRVRNTGFRVMWEYVHQYQRGIEKKLGLGSDAEPGDASRS